MGDLAKDLRVLASSRAWSATPWNYSSLRFIRLTEDGNGEFTYGYGQTIYSVIKCRWELPAADQLRLTYLELSPEKWLKEFTLNDGNRVKELAYRLTEGVVEGVESIVNLPFEFLWTLELSEPPWPTGLSLPYEVPRVFYGHRQSVQGKIT